MSSEKDPVQATVTQNTPIPFWQRRKFKKHRKAILHHCRHARHMKEDVADPKKLAELEAAEKAFAKMELTTKEKFAIEGDQLVNLANRIHPNESWPRLRENVEIFVVAIVVALGFRTYFLQPFNIPTGSMMPTLYGQTLENEGGIDRWDVNGNIDENGHVSLNKRLDKRVVDKNFLLDGFFIPFKNNPVSLRTMLTGRTRMPDGALRISGDHILVNKVKYHFAMPKRGDIIVFDTSEVEHEQMYRLDRFKRVVRKDKQFYIKRLVGLPNETISIDPPYLVVDGERITDDPIFKRVASEERDRSYPGYTSPGPSRPGISSVALGPEGIKLGEDEILPFGDNSRSSLDGRYFGPVSRRRLMGPAFAVYWPFFRFGFVE